jgi:toxin ParE1/3/4
MKTFFLTRSAKGSLQSIALYTEEKWGERQRNEYLQILDKGFYDLASSPLKGKLCEDISIGLRSYKECWGELSHYISLRPSLSS